MQTKITFKYVSWDTTEWNHLKKSVTLLCADAFSLRLSQVDWILDRTFERSFAIAVRFSLVTQSRPPALSWLLQFSDLTLGSFDSAFTATISSSLSSSCEFWEVDADRLEKNSSYQLAFSSVHVGRVESAFKCICLLFYLLMQFVCGEIKKINK